MRTLGGAPNRSQGVTPRRRADPAPSRLAWRFQRLMLTPTFRLGLRLGLPLVVVLGGGVIYFSSAAHRQEVVSFAQSEIERVKTLPQFMVTQVEITGATPDLEAEVRKSLGADLPVSTFHLDLDAAKSRIEAIPAVARASLRVHKGGVLAISIAERIPVAVWEGPDGIELLDTDGVAIGTLPSRLVRKDLPLLAGRGANHAVLQGLRILDAAQPIADRVRGLQRVGERRWDLVLDRGQRILLPEDHPVEALERVLALQKAQRILDRTVSVVDMRLAQRPTLRMTEPAAQNWRKMMQSVLKAGN